MRCAPRAGVRSLFVLALALPGSAALGNDLRPDEVEVVTRDGVRHVGRLIDDGAEQIALEVRRGGVSGQVTIPRAEVRSTRRGGVDPVVAERERRAEAARALPTASERAAALLRLAEEAEAERAFEAAGRWYLEAGDADPSLADQTDVSAARAFIAAGEEPLAGEALRRALARNPKNAHALAMSRRLEEAFAARAAELIEPGVRAWAERDPRRGLRLLARAVDELPRPVLDAASARVQEETGLTLAQVMVDCRLQAPCSGCDGAGALECPGARSNASTRCRFGRVFNILDAQRAGDVRVARADWCKQCNGFGHLTCEDCAGSGLSLGRPTEYERDELVKVLTEQLKGLEARAEVLSGKAEQGGEGTIRSVLASELLGALRGIRAHAGAIAKLDQRAAAIGGGDLRRRDRAASQREAAIMTMLANALYLAGEKRYEDAIGLEVGTEGTKLDPDRSTRARQAWEIVHQARVYLLQALELDPAAAAAGAGDLRRRLRLCEQFLDRTWRTYVAIRVAERSIDLPVVLGRAVEQALDSTGVAPGPGGGGGGGNGKGDGSFNGSASGKGSGSDGDGNATGRMSGGARR